MHAGGLVTQGLWELRICSPSPRPHLLPDIFLAPNAGSLPPRPMRTSEQAVVLLQDRALPPRTCSLVERPRTILVAGPRGRSESGAVWTSEIGRRPERAGDCLPERPGS